MAKEPAGKKPVPRKTERKKPATPAKKVAGKAAPARKQAASAKAPVKKPTAKRTTTTTKKEPSQTLLKKRVSVKKVSAQNAPQFGLTPKQQRFVDEYLVDMNGTQAAIRAKYSPDTARQMAAENLSKPYIQLAIAEARKAQQERTHISADKVVAELALIAFADARELAEVKTGCCRCCWGEGFKFQRTIGEFNHDREQWLSKGKELADFEDKGGIGFNPLKLPHVECPNCGGDGDARVVLKDTRTLSPQALALYAGAKIGKYGIEIQMHSKMDAIEKLAKHLGVYEKDNKQKVDPLSTLLHRISNGNANGFKPVQDDPESPAGGDSTSSLTPRQDISDDED